MIMYAGIRQSHCTNQTYFFLQKLTGLIRFRVPVVRQPVVRRGARKQFATNRASMAARKTVVQQPLVMQTETESFDGGRISDDEDLLPGPQDLQRTSSDPPEGLLLILEGKLLLMERLRRHRRLPFLRKNLVVGFRSRVRRQHPSATKLDACPGFKIEYALKGISDDDDELQGHVAFEGEAWSWSCPLCNMFGNLRSRAELKIHLSFSHKDFKCSWMTKEVRFPLLLVVEVS